MLFTPDMAVAFGDWLERDRIRQSLVAARPDLADGLRLDEERPLLQIPRPGGGAVLVAKIDEDPTAAWVVGIPGLPAPTLHRAGSLGEIVRRVFEALEASDGPGAGPSDRGRG